MTKTLLAAGVAASAVLALAAAPAFTQGKTVKIGLISTFGGPVATIGNDMRNSFELGLDHLGRKLGGLPVEVIYEDDQFKPEVGVQKTQKLIESDNVDFIVGYIWSNVLCVLSQSSIPDLHDHYNADLRRWRAAVFALRVLDLANDQTPSSRPLHDQKA
jgi:hypothetical protein